MRDFTGQIMILSFPMKSGVYQIRCLVDGRIYVGGSKRLSRRFCDHKRSLNRNEHWCVDLQEAWNRFGADKFSFEVLEHADSADILALEQAYLDKLQPYGERGFNRSKKANAARRDQSLPPEEAERWRKAFLGRKHTDEAKQLQREARLKDNWQRGRPWTEEQRRKTKRHSGENHHYFGQPRSEEVRRAISDKLSKPVAQLALNGALIRVWRSARDAGDAVGLKKGGGIHAVCKGTAKTAGGFKWAYVTAAKVAA